MAANSKIIELFGLPACGKTTLSRYLVENIDSSLKSTIFNEAIHGLRKRPWRLVRSVSVCNVYRALRLTFLASFNNKRQDAEWLVHGTTYRFLMKFTDYDQVFVDHGDIQSFVSMERGRDLHLDKNFSKACSNYLDTSPVFAYFYCKVDPHVALERMRQRGRVIGRIDTLEKDLQLKALEAESHRFDFFANMLKEKGIRFMELDMSKDVKRIAVDLIRLLSDNPNNTLL